MSTEDRVERRQDDPWRVAMEKKFNDMDAKVDANTDITRLTALKVDAATAKLDVSSAKIELSASKVDATYEAMTALEGAFKVFKWAAVFVKYLGMFAVGIAAIVAGWKFFGGDQNAASTFNHIDVPK